MILQKSSSPFEWKVYELVKFFKYSLGQVDLKVLTIVTGVIYLWAFGE